MERVAGVDGCRGGWIGAVWDGSGVEWRALPLAFGEMLDALHDCAVVAVDVPIGVLETGKRACDLAAREALRGVPGAASRVFVTPARAVLDAPSHAAACAVGREKEGWAPSVQTWGIAPRIRDAAAAARGVQRRVVEAHPEVSFLHMTGRVLPSKHTADGLAERRAALAPLFGVVDRGDDALDALACAWTARRVLDGNAVAYGEEPLVIRA